MRERLWTAPVVHREDHTSQALQVQFFILFFGRRGVVMWGNLAADPNCLSTGF